MKSCMTLSLVMMLALCSHAAAKSADNRPYAAAFANHSPFYARCIPAKASGNEGSTQILQVRPEGDEVVATFAWYWSKRGAMKLSWRVNSAFMAMIDSVCCSVGMLTGI